MIDIAYIIVIINIINLTLVAISTLIYLLTIIFVRRFHNSINILTGNVCLISVICALFWIMYNVLSVFYQTILIQSIVWCFISSYFQQLINCLLIYSLTMVTINRFLTINYPNKIFFKTKTWSFVSSIVQWIFAISLCIPHLILSVQVSYKLFQS